MNKKGDVIWDNTIYLLIGIAFFAMTFYFVVSQGNGAGIWSRYYAKEVSKIINLAEPGDVIELDIHKATEIAQKNKITNFNGTFNFDNMKNELCLKLSSGRRTCYSYFNDVDIVDVKIEQGVPINILKFRIAEKTHEKLL